MAPDESLWKPVIKMPEQCKLCQKYFHQDIAGVCRPCWKAYKKWEYNQPSKSEAIQTHESVNEESKLIDSGVE